MSERLTPERLAEIRERRDRAFDMISALCRPKGSPGSREWIMSIPARPDHDPDLVIGAALKDIDALLAHIDAQAAEIERLRGDVREWMCDHCNVVYPGPPADGVRCVVCSRCGGDTAPRTVVERRRLQRELDRSSAENARLISDIQSITAPVEVGGGADAYLRAEVERLRRERDEAQLWIAALVHLHGGHVRIPFRALTGVHRAFSRSTDPQTGDEFLTLLDGQKDEYTTTYRQMDEFADGWECTAPDCETAWSLPNGGPSHHRMRFCPGCGRRIAGEEPWRVEEGSA